MGTMAVDVSTTTAADDGDGDDDDDDDEKAVISGPRRPLMSVDERILCLTSSSNKGSTMVAL